MQAAVPASWGTPYVHFRINIALADGDLSRNRCGAPAVGRAGADIVYTDGDPTDARVCELPADVRLCERSTVARLAQSDRASDS